MVCQNHNVDAFVTLASSEWNIVTKIHVFEKLFFEYNHIVYRFVLLTIVVYMISERTTYLIRCDISLSAHGLSF